MSELDALHEWRDELDYMTSNGSEVALLTWAIAQIESRQQTTSEDVQKAIHWFSDRSSVAVYMNGEVQPNFHKAHQDVLHTIDNILQQYAPPTSEATQKAIEWQQSLKQHHQREWEKTDIDWQMEPGAQEQHEAMMASFDMAIQALQQYAPKEPCDIALDAKTGNYIQTCPDCSFTVEGIRRPASFCPNCGNDLKAGE
jgi:rubrerythrin